MKTKLANFPLRKYRINFVSLIREKRRRERNRFPFFFYYSHNQQFSFITFHRTFIIRINFCPIIFYFQHQSSTPMGLKKVFFLRRGKMFTFTRLLSHYFLIRASCFQNTNICEALPSRNILSRS